VFLQVFRTGACNFVIQKCVSFSTMKVDLKSFLSKSITHLNFPNFTAISTHINNCQVHNKFTTDRLRIDVYFQQQYLLHLCSDSEPLAERMQISALKFILPTNRASLRKLIKLRTEHVYSET
jgi:hypothetical protein